MNKEKLMGYWEKIKTALGKVSKKIWIIIAVALVLIIAAVALFWFNRPYAVLIDGATSEEAAAVVSWLDEQGVTDYRMEGTGTILVPQGQAHNLKARLLVQQYSQPSSSFSLYFEKVSALSTESERGVTWLVALEEELENTIRQFPGVRDVDVEINTGEDRRYVLDSANVVEASAGVMLTMQNNKLLTTEQANAIRNYIAHSVASLDVENVSIQDTNGNIYDLIASTGSSAADSSALKIQMEQYWSNFYRNQLEQLLLPVFGEGNFSVNVHPTVELGDKTINDYQVHLPDFAIENGTGAGIIGKRAYAYQFQVGDDYNIGGVVGTSSNADLPTYVEEGETIEEALRRLVGEGSIEYDNSKTQTYMVINSATLTDITAAISVNSRTAEDVDVQQLTHWLANSVGIQAPLELPEGVTEDDYLSRKISVLYIPFYQVAEDPTPVQPQPDGVLGIPYWVFIAAGAGLLVFAIVLTIILLVRRKKRKKQEEEQKAVEELLATAMPGQAGEPGAEGESVQPELDEYGRPVSGADVMDLHTERSMELRQGIRDFVDENMEVAALLIKSWLKEDGDNG